MVTELSAAELLDVYLAELVAVPYWRQDPKAFPTGQAILKADEQTRLKVLCLVMQRTLTGDVLSQTSYRLIMRLCKTNLSYTVADMRCILQALAQAPSLYSFPAQALLRSLVRSLSAPAMLDGCRSDLELLLPVVSAWYNNADQQKLLKLIHEILLGQQSSVVTILADDWGKQVMVWLQEMEPEQQERWLAILKHCARAGKVPRKKWLQQALALIDVLGREQCVQLAAAWLNAFGRKHGARLDEENVRLLRGLAWCCTHLPDVTIAAALADAAIEGYRKISGSGPRSPKIARACVYALKCMAELRELERISQNVKQPSYQRELERALTEAAQFAQVRNSPV